jgi:hypothetical protein
MTQEAELGVPVRKPEKKSADDNSEDTFDVLTKAFHPISLIV